MSHAKTKYTVFKAQLRSQVIPASTGNAFTIMLRKHLHHNFQQALQLFIANNTSVNMYGQKIHTLDLWLAWKYCIADVSRPIILDWSTEARDQKLSEGFSQYCQLLRRDFSLLRFSAKILKRPEPNHPRRSNEWNLSSHCSLEDFCGLLKSFWANPCDLVPKKGTSRSRDDYRELSVVTIHYRYPILHIRDASLPAWVGTQSFLKLIH